jgi:hypothetical protein
MASKFSARECIPIEYIKEQIEEYAKFDHLRANAEFLDWFIKDYKDNAMANYEREADTPQTDLGKPIECDGCGEHICIGCEHQAKKEAWRKAQTDCGWK